MMNNELGGEIIREFVVFYPKIYSYITVGDNAEKGQRKKKISNQM